MDVLAAFLTARSGILALLGLASLALEVAAFVTALTFRADAYVAAGKLTRPVWLLILGVAALLGFVVVLNPLSLFGLLAVGAAILFWVDVRPALRRVMGNASTPSRRPW